MAIIPLVLPYGKHRRTSILGLYIQCHQEDMQLLYAITNALLSHRAGRVFSVTLTLNPSPPVIWSAIFMSQIR